MSHTDDTDAHLKGARVLLIEDEILVTFDLQRLLAGHGLVVVGTAAQLKAAAKLAANIECDVAIVDVDLRGEYSHTLADILRSRNIPFVVYTGYADASAYNLPEPLVLHKPASDKEILTALISALRKKP